MPVRLFGGSRSCFELLALWLVGEGEVAVDFVVVAAGAVGGVRGVRFRLLGEEPVAPGRFPVRFAALGRRVAPASSRRICGIRAGYRGQGIACGDVWVFAWAPAEFEARAALIAWPVDETALAVTCVSFGFVCEFAEATRLAISHRHFAG